MKYIVSFELNLLLLLLKPSFWASYLQCFPASCQFCFLKPLTPASTWLSSFLMTVIRKIACVLQFTGHRIFTQVLYTSKFYMCMYGDTHGLDHTLVFVIKFLIYFCFSAFNNVYSNIGYIMLGILFILLVVRRCVSLYHKEYIKGKTLKTWPP